MKLVIGGFSQGKLEFVKREWLSVQEGMLMDHAPEVLEQLHIFVRNSLLAGRCPEHEVAEYVALHPDCIIISDEIGNGIVPMDAFEREYRERCGRILVNLAKEADEVVRVVCGIGQKIK